MATTLTTAEAADKIQDLRDEWRAGTDSAYRDALELGELVSELTDDGWGLSAQAIAGTLATLRLRSRDRLAQVKAIVDQITYDATPRCYDL